MRSLFSTAFFLLLSTVCLPFAGAQAAAPARLPNIVIIYIDDMGYADIGPFGAKGYRDPEPRPHGRRGHEVHQLLRRPRPSAPPSRAALMTGCYSNRVGIPGAWAPRPRSASRDKEMTLAQLLQAEGYATAIFGKWHLGDAAAIPADAARLRRILRPALLQRHVAAEQPPIRRRCRLSSRSEVVNPSVDHAAQDQLTTQYTEHAVELHRAEQGPARSSSMCRTRWSTCRCTSPTSSAARPQRGLFGDVVEEVDWSVGQILGAIKKDGLDDDTLVIFCSDNGPWLCYGDHAGSADPLREGKGTSWDGGVREPTLMRWPGHIPAGKSCDEPLMTIDIFPTVAQLIGGKLPDHKIDGLDITDVITGKTAKSPHEVLYFYYGQNNLEALRSGKWKLELPRPYASLNGRPGGHGGKRVPYETLKITSAGALRSGYRSGPEAQRGRPIPGCACKDVGLCGAGPRRTWRRLYETRGTGRRQPGRLPPQSPAKPAAKAAT